MESVVETESSIAGPTGIGKRLAFWVLLKGNRLAVAGGLVFVSIMILWSLIAAGVLAVGAHSSAATLFASGLTAGVVTLITIALSVNQLILSRVFGSPNGLTDRIDATRMFRDNVEDLASKPSSPNDPAAFLMLLGRTLADRSGALEETSAESVWSAPDETMSAIRDVTTYGENIADELHEEADIVDVLNVVLGNQYAVNMTAVRHLRDSHGASLPEDVQADFDAVEELLESLAVARQFFKTLSLQQDFARLSRYLIYSGLVALLSTISLTLIYQTNSVTIPPTYVPAVVVIGLGFAVVPFAVFTAFLLRAATIAERTVSVGPFVPPAAK